MAVIDKGNLHAFAFGTFDGFGDKGHVRCWANEVNIVNAHIFKAKEDFDEPFQGDTLPFAFVTNLEILAIDAPKITGSKKYVSRTTCARDWGLLTKMGAEMSNEYFLPYAAISNITPNPVYSAGPRAQSTVF